MAKPDPEKNNFGSNVLGISKTGVEKERKYELKGEMRNMNGERGRKNAKWGKNKGKKGERNRYRAMWDGGGFFLDELQATMIETCHVTMLKSTNFNI
jgi:hypothetical protein